MRQLFSKFIPWLRVWWVHLVVIAVEGALLVWVIRLGPIHLSFPVQRGTPWWEKFPWQAAVTAVGGVVALGTFLLNRSQKQEHFERQALDTQFTDILNRFSSDRPIMRANAAIRLAEMAAQRWPGRPADLTRENYPFFPRVASQLAAALHMEEDRAVRDEIGKALGRTAEFAKQGNQALLYVLISELADANRSAKKTFIRLLAHYCSAHEEVTDEVLRPLTNFAPFCVGERDTLACLRDLADSGDCRAAAVCRALGQARDETAAPNAPNLLEEIHSAAARLKDTVHALATALRGLSDPRGVPSTAPSLRKWAREPELKLQGCFLAGANLIQAQLQEALLAGAQLQGADLWIAELQEANLFQAQLQGANLRGARLQGANLSQAQLQGADLWRARLQGADLRGAQLDGACLFRVVVEEKISETYRRANFTGAHWWDADFTDPGTRAVDKDLRDWLEKHFPRPEEPAQPRQARKWKPPPEA
ncbi:MAG: pentapeptide repeat-containing protein [Armatimonadetes bacterium]|nr:pentapeptide repeat-containing protein [Armatimonadota bacterium]